MACDLNTLVSESSCLNCLSESEKQNAFLYYLAKAVLAKQGGLDYSKLDTLRDAVSCWCVGGAVLDSFKARVAIDEAVAAGAVSSPAIEDVRAAIKCWSCDLGGNERKAMEVFLLCQYFSAT